MKRIDKMMDAYEDSMKRSTDSFCRTAVKKAIEEVGPIDSKYKRRLVFILINALTDHMGLPMATIAARETYHLDLR